MKATLDRGRFLAALEAVRPGLSHKPMIDYSDSFVFRKGYVTTYNEAIACRMRTKLPKDLCCVIHHKSLLAYLNKIQDDSITIKLDAGNKEFKVVGSGKGADYLPIFDTEFKVDEVPRPGKDSWKPLSPLFGDAISMVVECASKDRSSDKALTCVHITPKFVEASDDTQWCYFRVKTPIAESFLVREDAIRHIPKLDMTEFAETDSHVHFRNPAGLVYSCKRLAQKYADSTAYRKGPAGGKKMTLPKELGKAVEGVNVFAQEDKDANTVVVELEPRTFRIRGIGVSGKAYARERCDYAGKPLAFLIKPDMLTEIGKRSKDCIIDEGRLWMSGDRWLFVTDLASPDAVRKAAEARAASVKEQQDDED